MLIKSFNEIPSKPGTYILQLVLDEPVVATIGKLGEHSLRSGSYLYVGSALGSGGLRSRIRHHHRITQTRRWHIDWLRPFARIQAITFLLSPERLECALVKRIASLPGVTTPIPGFGSSDCQNNCPAHLLYLPQEICWEEIFQKIYMSVARKDFVIIGHSLLTNN